MRLLLVSMWPEYVHRELELARKAADEPGVSLSTKLHDMLRKFAHDIEILYAVQHSGGTQRSPLTSLY